MSGVDQLFGNAVGKKRLSYPGISIEKQILKRGVKIFDEIPGPAYCVPGRLPGGKAGGGADDIIGVKIKRKMIEIFRLKNIPDI